MVKCYANKDKGPIFYHVKTGIGVGTYMSDQQIFVEISAQFDNSMQK